MDSIIADTSGLLAALDAKEPKHRSVIAAVEDVEPGSLVLSPIVLAEIDFWLVKRLGVSAEITFLEDVAVGRYTLAPWDNDDLRVALDVVTQYRDLAIGVGDASNVVLAQRYETTTILTLDDHYRAVRPLAGEAFTMLPADR